MTATVLAAQAPISRMLVGKLSFQYSFILPQILNLSCLFMSLISAWAR
jgi:hypothetical protein